MEYTKQLAVCYFCTKAEYLSGELKDSINRFLSMKPSRKYCFDLFLVFDQGNGSDYSSILDFESHNNVNSITIHSLDIEAKDNIYVRSRHSLRKFKELGEPSLGLSSGPNNLFFNGMNFLLNKDYENYMVLEADTRPVKYFWFDRMYKYCSEEDFLIAGSHYEGIVEVPEDCEWKDHLNGVAIYKNCDLSKELLSESLSKVKQMIKEGVHGYFINYDIGIFYTIESSEENINKYKSGYKDTKLISNMSLGIDSKLKESYICQKNRDLVILHQKNRFLS